MSNWADYKVGMSSEELETSGIAFERKPWDIEGEQFIGMLFSDLVPILLKESRFSYNRFTPPDWIGSYQGGIIEATLKYYGINPHEETSEERKTGEGKEQLYWPVAVLPDGSMRVPVGTIQDLFAGGEDSAVALTSRVVLNNLSRPGEYGGIAHFPMLDIVHSPTEENIKYLITAVREKCGLENFFVIQSSDNGMMIIGAELFDEENFVALLMDSLLINHVETKGIDGFWVDDRWNARSTQNGVVETGDRLNRWRFNGVLRMVASLPNKPCRPFVKAAFLNGVVYGVSC